MIWFNDVGLRLHPIVGKAPDERFIHFRKMFHVQVVEATPMNVHFVVAKKEGNETYIKVASD